MYVFNKAIKSQFLVFGQRLGDGLNFVVCKCVLNFLKVSPVP